MDEKESSSVVRRLTLSRENFDDYFVALTAKLRSNLEADGILSGELQHPLLHFQDRNSQALRRLNVQWVTPALLFADPVGPYLIFIRQLTDALLNAPAPIPDIEGLDELQTAQAAFRKAETYIYTTIVETLRVGKSMHYARQVKFGAGQQLLQNIVNDNRVVTTRSLMAVFSTLFSLALDSDESFEQFE